MNAGSDLHVPLPVEPGVVEGDDDEVAHGVGDAGADHVVARLGLLQHPPHRVDVVAGEAPVAVGVEVAEPELAGQAELDAGHAVGHLAGDELDARAAATRG